MDTKIFSLREKLSSFLEAESDFTYKRLILFGAGNTYQLYKKTIELEGLNFECIWDNNPDKFTQREFAGVTVDSPEKYIAGHPMDKSTLVLIASNSKARYEIKTQLDAIGIRNMILDAFLFRKHKSEIMDIFDMLEDDLSKQTYAHIILTRAGGEEYFPKEIFCPDAYYTLPSFFSMKKNEVFVDLGAYVGDTLETFIWKTAGEFKKVYLFEPNENNVSALMIRAERLKREWSINDDKIEIVKAGIGSKSEILYIDPEFSGSPSSRKILETQSENKKMVQVHSIDEFFLNKQEKVTFIKADIESFEYDMLCGAKEMIQKYHPRLAICIYHGASDMYKIPLLIREYCPDYKIAIRHHSVTLSETVVYAYCDDLFQWVDLHE